MTLFPFHTAAGAFILMKFTISITRYQTRYIINLPVYCINSNTQFTILASSTVTAACRYLSGVLFFVFLFRKKLSPANNNFFGHVSMYHCRRLWWHYRASQLMFLLRDPKRSILVSDLKYFTFRV